MLCIEPMKWYTYKELCTIKKNMGWTFSAKSLCDIQSSGKANGGYGCNVIEKLRTYQVW